MVDKERVGTDGSIQNRRGRRGDKRASKDLHIVMRRRIFLKGYNPFYIGVSFEVLSAREDVHIDLLPCFTHSAKTKRFSQTLL